MIYVCDGETDARHPQMDTVSWQKGKKMRLIDADAVYKILESCEIRKATIGNPLTDWEHGYTCGIERAESEIECAPTVDAIPVIRCKDCIHRYSTCPMITIHPTGSITFRAQDDWFCFMGERKEE